MAATRSRKQEKEYKAYLKTIDRNGCVFCEIETENKQLILETKCCRVIENIFPYSLWELIEVKEHLMITPKRHISSLGDLNDEESQDYMKLLQKFEKKGYNLYCRSPNSPTKSVPHQHMHLIKTQGSPRRAVLKLKKPAIRITIK